MYEVRPSATWKTFFIEHEGKVIATCFKREHADLICELLNGNRTKIVSDNRGTYKEIKQQ